MDDSSTARTRLRSLIASNIRAERARARCTQRSLARRCGFGIWKLREIERVGPPHKGEIAIDDLWLIALALGCAFTDLLPPQMRQEGSNGEAAERIADLVSDRNL